MPWATPPGPRRDVDEYGDTAWDADNAEVRWHGLESIALPTLAAAAKGGERLRAFAAFVLVPTLSSTSTTCSTLCSVTLLSPS